MLAGAELIFTSDLTLIECDRVIIRATTLGLLTEVVAADRRAMLRQLAEHWIVFFSRKMDMMSTKRHHSSSEWFLKSRGADGKARRM